MLDSTFLRVFGKATMKALAVGLNPLAHNKFDVWLYERLVELVNVFFDTFPDEAHELPAVFGEGGKKFDSGKVKIFPGYNLILEAAQKASLYGKDKYGRYDQFTEGLAPERVINSYYRHLLQSEGSRHNLDDESGLPHLYHAASCLLMLAVISDRSKNETH